MGMGMVDLDIVNGFVSFVFFFFFLVLVSCCHIEERGRGRKRKIIINKWIEHENKTCDIECVVK